MSARSSRFRIGQVVLSRKPERMWGCIMIAYIQESHLLAPPGRRGNRHLARNPDLKARKEFSRKRYFGAARPVCMLRVVSRLARPESLVVIEIVAAKA